MEGQMDLCNSRLHGRREKYVWDLPEKLEKDTKETSGYRDAP